MKKVYKRLFSLLLVLLALFTLAGCNVASSPSISTNISSTEISTSSSEKVEAWKSGKTVHGVSLDYSLTLEDVEEAKAIMDYSFDVVSEGTDLEGFFDIVNYANTYIHKVAVAEQYETLLYELYGKKENQDKYLYFYDLEVEFNQWADKINHAIAKSSFKEEYYQGMTDEEIEEQIGASMPDSYYELLKEENKLNGDYLSLDKSNPTKHMEEIDKLYKRLMEVHNELAIFYGYNDYLEYSYKEKYYREYEVSKTNEFSQYVMHYILPIYKTIFDEANALVDRLSQPEKEIFEKIMNGDTFSTAFDYITDYFDYFGGFVKEYGDGLFCDGGYYFISYEDKSRDGAYQNFLKKDKGDSHPYVFYGNGYHNATTIVHEFGHYMSAMTGGDNTSYDGAETQSQVNEFLFFEYLNNSSKYGFSDDLKKALLYSHYARSYKAIILGVVINDMEKKLYSREYQIGDIEKEINAIYDQYTTLETVYEKRYMVYYTLMVAFESPAYYISYSTSLLGSLYVDKIAQSNYDNAKEVYRKLIYNKDHDYNISDLYIKCGLGDPFAETTFQYIFSN